MNSESHGLKAFREMFMKSVLRTTTIGFLALYGLFSPAGAEIVLLGSVSTAGNTADRSGLSDSIGQGTPHNLFGAVSGLEHVGDNHYLALSDRGPLDGASQFQCRFHAIELSIEPAGDRSTRFHMLQTTLLKTEEGIPLVGALEAFNTQVPSKSLRLDPEALRVGSLDAVYISDEYGPFLYQFDLAGSRRRIFRTPSEFLIAQPSADPKQEDKSNVMGRAANSGWEGMAITPDGSHLMLATQKSLLQDRVVRDGQKSPSRVVRLLQLDLQSGASQQFACLLDDTKCGISEILAVSPSEFLILERDGLSGAEARMKRIYRVSTKGATDVSPIQSLAGEQLPTDVVPVTKSLLIDLLDPRWEFAGAECPEKWESLAFGPTSPDGRRLLWVATDNDYVPDSRTWFHAFGIDPDELPDFSWKK